MERHACDLSRGANCLRVLSMETCTGDNLAISVTITVDAVGRQAIGIRNRLSRTKAHVAHPFVCDCRVAPPSQAPGSSDPSKWKETKSTERSFQSKGCARPGLTIRAPFFDPAIRVFQLAPFRALPSLPSHLANVYASRRYILSRCSPRLWGHLNIGTNASKTQKLQPRLLQIGRRGPVVFARDV